LVGQDRQTVAQLEPETLNTIVDYDNILQLPVLNNPEVLYVVALLCLKTAIPTEIVSYVGVALVQTLDGSLRVGISGRSKHVDLVVLT
jgi:hypothetical protein